jgi:hypothetical protein
LGYLTNKQEGEMIKKVELRGTDIGDVTLNEFLRRLLLGVFIDGECFSGKRPFGNSGWEYSIYEALIRDGLIEGKLDSDGYVEKMNREKGEEFVKAYIDQIFNQNDIREIAEL